MIEKPVFSVVMASYNSEKTIEKALSSIRRQDFEQDKIEILVVDGMSSDRTREIAKKYNAIVLDNEARLPEPAKVIGLKAAKGKYLCIMDSDEELPRTDMFTKRYNVLQKYKQVKCMVIGLFTPNESLPCTYYINAVGDPFTCFVYKTFKDSMEGVVKRKTSYDKDNDCYVAYFDEDEIKPVGDSGTIMDLVYIRENYSGIIETLTTSALFDRLLTDTGYVAFVNNDCHKHYTSASFKVYLKKLKFRIVNNIFNIEGSGYASKAQTNKKLSLRKYLFPFYTATFILPFIDGIRMSINYKHVVFMAHPFFCIYVMVEIAENYLKKLFGRKSEVKTYGE